MLQYQPFSAKYTQIYFCGLICIAITCIRSFTTENTLEVGWSKLPKDRTDMNNRSMDLLFGQKTEGCDGRFVLDRTIIFGKLPNQWCVA